MSPTNTIMWIQSYKSWKLQSMSYQLFTKYLCWKFCCEPQHWTAWRKQTFFTPQLILWKNKGPMILHASRAHAYFYLVQHWTRHLKFIQCCTRTCARTCTRQHYWYGICLTTWGNMSSMTTCNLQQSCKEHFLFNRKHLPHATTSRNRYKTEMVKSCGTAQK